MITNQKKTALLVFSLSREKEIERKAIFHGHHKKGNRVLFHLLIEQTKKLAHHCGIDAIWMDEHQQTGPDFASRFTNAYQRLFDEGYENVVSIGNDCPDLTIELLTDAVASLRNNSMVLGPSSDGGVYLLGINRAVFDKDSFHRLPWQIETLQQGLETYGQTQDIEVEWLQELRDIDSFKDLREYVQTGPSTVVARLFRAIMESMRIIVFSIFKDVIPSFFKYSHIGLRAPPIV
ncbi:DUF2064 domain-containing protein [Allomuricauda sp. F6463D]|uniref:TIGR04282 family arsenosugar biosynthesis glycosyltransferase n=1 Tax=Allomuricauda sp. F6463D TaxID=2926409 RepID=UPI001FF23835|nr:DUF2064 domain-containing protein [Muricauda sp. F6463D]MCK0160047.1 DUF2064 domain-containing protein [Muricauda sp. F6463D]